MQDREADGSVFIGPPGDAKVCDSKGHGRYGGNSHDCFRLASHGEFAGRCSTGRLRTALQIIDAVSQGRMLFIATWTPSRVCHPNRVGASRRHVLLRPAHGRGARDD